MTFTKISDGDPVLAEPIMSNFIDTLPRDSDGEPVDGQVNLGSQEARYNKVFCNEVSIGVSALFSGKLNGAIGTNVNQEAAFPIQALVDSTGTMFDANTSQHNIVIPETGTYFIYVNITSNRDNAYIIIHKNSPVIHLKWLRFGCNECEIAINASQGDVIWFGWVVSSGSGLQYFAENDDGGRQSFSVMVARALGL